MKDGVYFRGGVESVVGASDRDFPAELHQVGIDETATMTKSNRRDDVALRLDSDRDCIVYAIAANLTKSLI
jgi:hypothetical protein